jgi:hypothetical protein
MKKIYLLIYFCAILATVLNAQWSLTGNSVTSTNFLGTTNAQALLFKANGTQVGQLQYGSSANVSFGVSAGNGWNTLCCNVAIGYQSLSANTSSNNTGVGNSTLSANTSGQQNTAIGSYNSYQITTGSYNTSVGAYTAASLTTGTDNCSFGEGTLRSITTASYNCAYGDVSLNQNTASYNSAFGYYSLYSNTSGTPNCAFGYNASYGNTTGGDNVAVGNSALYYNTTGSQNTAIGDNAGPGSGSTNLSNTGAFGYGATVTASNSIVFGNSSITSIGGYAAWTNFSDGRYKKNIKENIPGLAFIKLLRPITYNIDVTAIDAVTRPDKRNSMTQAELAAQKQKEQIIYTGFVAQEVEASAKRLGFEFSGVKTPQNDKDFYGLRYAEFVVPLVKAVQEISGTNDSLKAVINDLTTQLANVQEQLKKFNAALIAGEFPLLKQNLPNPFDKSSVIAYNLPSNTHKAILTITDAQGKVLKNVALNNSKGPGQAIINAGTLSSGVYYYSLIVNGKLIDTKSMVLAK